jgi:hypothetical protein
MFIGSMTFNKASEPQFTHLKMSTPDLVELLFSLSDTGM